MTIRQALSGAQKELQSVTKFPWREAEDLLSWALKISRGEFLRLDLDKSLFIGETRRFHQAVRKRGRGVPLPYILGHQQFYGLDFLVTPSVLIPRPETEVLVETALEQIKSNSPQPPLNIRGGEGELSRYVIADLGTGSGCIIVSLVKKMQIQYQEVPLPSEVGIPQIEFFATDISSAALAVAKKNARLHGVANLITFLKGDLLKPLKEKPDLIVANLPYLSAALLRGKAALHQEPRLALVGGHDGLAVYKKLFRQLQSRGWANIKLLLEIDPKQKNAMAKLVNSFWPDTKICFVKDFNGLTRLAELEV